MEISCNAATAKGPAETFTGDVWVDPITRGLPRSQLNVAAVRFTPGARSAWHSHDGGQSLYVTEGHGLVQVRGQQIAKLDPGDVVFAPDGEEHWHGATPDHFMTHLSITEGAPHWGPHVTDAEYQGQQDPRKRRCSRRIGSGGLGQPSHVARAGFPPRGLTLACGTDGDYACTCGHWAAAVSKSQRSGSAAWA
jgi:quercetin dioxygenase-like cupin family protein